MLGTTSGLSAETSAAAGADTDASGGADSDADAYSGADVCADADADAETDANANAASNAAAAAASATLLPGWVLDQRTFSTFDQSTVYIPAACFARHQPSLPESLCATTLTVRCASEVIRR